MLEDVERALNLKRILRHEREVRAERSAHENRIRLEKIQLIGEFLSAMDRAKTVDKRVPLIVCTNQYPI